MCWASTITQRTQTMQEAETVGLNVVTRLRAWRSGVLIPDGHAIYLFSRTVSQVHPVCYAVCTGVFILQYSGYVIRLPTHLDLVPRVMTGAIHPRPVYALIARSGTIVRVSLPVHTYIGIRGSLSPTNTGDELQVVTEIGWRRQH